jgi:hypothetical protein
LLFITEEIPSKVFNEESGCYSIQKGWVGGEIVGRGSCVSCGLVQNSIQWPEAAFLQVTVREGVVWAWNDEYLIVLRARIAGAKTELRHMTMFDWDIARFISRLPKFALLTKNRSKILKGFNKLILDERK